MQAEFWHERWEQNQIGFHQGEFNSLLQRYWAQLAIPEGSGVFVPLCGKSRDMLWLRAQGLNVTGIELSPIAVRDFFAENALAPMVTQQGKFERWESDGLAILLGDFFDLQTSDVADCVVTYDRASLIAMPPDMRTAYAAHLTALLPVPTLLVTMEYDQQEMAGPPFAVHEAEVQALYAPHFQVTQWFHADVLRENSGFRQRGLTALVEGVYHLAPR